MKFYRWVCLLLACFIIIQSTAQKTGVTILHIGTPCSIRGMSIPSDNVIWVSGSNGLIGKSTDEGKTWKWMVVKGYEKTDFRDIQAFDSLTAIIMGVSNPAYILKTVDGGLSWKLVYTKNLTGMFLDAMDFRNNKEGICIGDPIAVGSGGRKFFFVLRTKDGGETWQEEPLYKMPPAQDGEGIFSASGTNIAMLKHPDFDYAFVSGGTVSNFYLIGREGKQNKGCQIPINQGIETTGAFSLATDGKKNFYCIGGNYKNPIQVYDNFYWTGDEGKKWASPSVAPPYGYRSCIQIIGEGKMVACGTNGVDICKNSPNNWSSVTKEGFNVCMVSPTKKLVFLGGEKGKIGLLKY
ncbi:MAG: oxidoreductase [Chitinophagaceae bacterium]|nr:oxidoreductase [Chitinophagaceae bacterium]